MGSLPISSAFCFISDPHSTMFLRTLEPVLQVRLQAVQPSLGPGLVRLDTANYSQVEASHQAIHVLAQSQVQYHSLYCSYGSPGIL